MRGDFDYEFIRKQMEESLGTFDPGDNILEQMHESIEQSNKENAQTTKKQNLITNSVQIATLVIAFLTLVATIVFGTLGLRN